MNDVFRNLSIIEKLLEQRTDPNISNYITIRLVTILEQFCRKIIQHQIDEEGVRVPQEITIQTDDLDTNKDRSKGSIISISYNFQNADEIKKQFNNYGIKIHKNSEEIDKIKELTDKRHNVVHSVSTIDYDVKRGYEAVEGFMKHTCEKVFNTDSRFYMLKGTALLIQNRFHEAVECFDEGIKLDGKKPTIYVSKGRALQFLDKNEEAVECFDEAIKLWPKNGTLHLHKGMTLQFLDKDDKAVECFDKAVECFDETIRMHPQDHLYSDKGLTLWNLGKNEEAFKCLDEGIKLWPKNGALYRYKGFALLSLGKSEEAVECFDEAINLGEKYLGLYLHKGFALQSFGKYSQEQKFVSKHLL